MQTDTSIVYTYSYRPRRHAANKHNTNRTFNKNQKSTNVAFDDNKWFHSTVFIDYAVFHNVVLLCSSNNTPKIFQNIYLLLSDPLLNFITVPFR